MKSLLITFMITGLVSAPSCACFRSNGQEDSKTMNTLGVQLLQLTSKVSGTIREDPTGTAALSDRELLERSTSTDPTLLKSFDRYKVTIQRADKEVSLLVCTRDGARGLLEDASCTGKLDLTLWERSPAAACQPTLQFPAACKP
jgi:hypothetical protein